MSVTASIQDWVSIGRDAIAAMAICVGGIWFLRTRQRLPWAELQHEVHWLDLDEEHQLIRVTATLKNVGRVLITVDQGHVAIQQVLPPDEKVVKFGFGVEGYEPDKPWREVELPWPEIGRKLIQKSAEDEPCFEVEPGERHSMPIDFVVGREIAAVSVTTYMRNIKKPSKGGPLSARSRKIGWILTTLEHKERDREEAAAGETTARDESNSP